MSKLADTLALLQFGDSFFPSGRGFLLVGARRIGG